LLRDLRSSEEEIDVNTTVGTLCVAVSLTISLSAQSRPAPPAAPEQNLPVAADATTPRPPSARVAPQTAPGNLDYRVGPGDRLGIAVLQVPEMKTSVRVSQQGAVSLPLLGIVQVSGLSAADVERKIADELRRKYVRDPQVSVQVEEIESHPISVVGAVAEPGIFQVRGPMNLLSVLSLAKGVTDTAGNRVVVVRADAAVAPLDLDLKQLLESGDPSLNVVIHPGDVVKVPPAPMIYIVGEFKKPGAFPMPRGDRLTVLRALALGEGLGPMADKKDAVIMRVSSDGSQAEIGIRLDRIIKAEEPDPVLQANDVLFVPGSGGKAAAQATLNVISRLIMFRPF
jgi:polysaccharide export outer membrane protein